MASIIDMRDLRHLNLFVRVTRVPTRFCFEYNNAIIFCVPKGLVSKSIGKEAQNVRKISGIIKKRVKVIPKPNSIEDVKWFIEKIVEPVQFKDVEVKDNEVVLTAGSQSKAALLGRHKRRLIEMQSIVKSFFGKEFRIV
tara:strand:+ start:25 stop:441 length:417 start_codon:yes stop_codon:yes gene_type:complete